MTSTEVQEMIYGDLANAIFHPLFQAKTKFFLGAPCDVDDCQCGCHQDAEPGEYGDDA